MIPKGEMYVLLNPTAMIMETTDNEINKELKRRLRSLQLITTVHKHAEERIKHLNAVLKASRRVNRTIIREKNRTRLCQTICEDLIETRGYFNAWIALFGEYNSVLLFTEAGADDHLALLQDKIVGGDLPYCCQIALRQPLLTAIENPRLTCDDCPLAQHYEECGGLSIRLQHEDKVYGVLTVSVPAIYCQDRDEHLLFTMLANDIAYALHGIEIEEERRLAEQKLRTARDELEKNVQDRTRELIHLSSKLLSAQEEERKRIAADLHDGIGQSLSAVKFVVENVVEQLNGSNGNQAVDALSSLVPMLQKASEEVRTIVMNLRPSILDDLGLLATIAWFCRQFHTIYKSININREILIEDKDIPENLKIIIFRVLQEAMNNIAKHSYADHVQLRLVKQADSIFLQISDNGIGFNLSHIQQAVSSDKGMGITGMKERTELSGGKFRIASSVDKGTVVTATWNYEKIRSFS